MNTKLVLLLVYFTLLGIFLVGSGITGKVISESCCFPPNCDRENICDFAQPNFEVPQAPVPNVMYVFLGVQIILICFGMYIRGYKR
jgi:hypothetical protein